MPVYKKLQEARIMLQSLKLEKTGDNKFAGFKYFELGDFLPQVQTIFNEIGLCGVVSYTEDIATLKIVDIEDSSEIVITSPMGSAALKGVHVVQNIGAVETYQRRYLWITAMEIVEHDALDADAGNDAGKVVSKQKTVTKAVNTNCLLPEEMDNALLSMLEVTTVDDLNNIVNQYLETANKEQKKVLKVAYEKSKSILENV